MRPGITGYSQAYFRNSITQNEKFQHDCYYVDNLSFVMDIKIIFATVISVLRKKNIFVEQPLATTVDKVSENAVTEEVGTSK